MDQDGIGARFAMALVTVHEVDLHVSFGLALKAWPSDCITSVRKRASVIEVSTENAPGLVSPHTHTA